METFAALLSRRARECPDATAFTFLSDGEIPSASWTRAELEQAALAVAAALRGAEGERALLLYPPGLAFVAAFYGCLYAGVIAVPAYPPDPERLERTLPRLLAIAGDARPSLILGTAEVCAAGQALPGFGAARWIATDRLPPAPPAERPAGAEPDRVPPDRVPPDRVAFLQYTSGSTRNPRGVMITHRNLDDNARVIARALGVGEGAPTVSWLPSYHDMGLMNGVLMPVWSGGHCLLMAPVDFIRRPIRWLRAISRYGAEYSGGPNFAYELCVRRIPPEQRAGLDLSSWRAACNGAEPVRPATLERFVEAFGPCGFRATSFSPAYGLAESTVYVSSCAVEVAPRTLTTSTSGGPRASARSLVPSPGVEGLPEGGLVGYGRVPDHWELRVVDPEARLPLPEGQVGEIWLRGPSVGEGYWGDPVATAEVFGARRADDPEAGPYLRTGDLGFLLEEELYVSGRLKDLIVIRGACHYPQDLEHTVEDSHPAIRPGSVAAFALEGEGEERLGIVAEAVPGPEGADEILTAIRDRVARRHDLFAHTVALIPSGTVPKTSSGKIQRGACRAALAQGRLPLVASVAGGPR